LIPVPAQIVAPIRTIPTPRFTARSRRQRGSACLARVLPEGANQKNSAEKKNESGVEDKEENKTGRSQVTAGHNLKRYKAPARRSAQVESQS
jgi:hypothetical protein